MRALDRFVQVETGLLRSKLVDRLLGALPDTPPAVIVGCLVLLWSEALDARTRGDLSERSDRWIEDAARWPGKPGQFAAAIRAHHLDERGVIRDFDEKYGKLDVERGKATRIKQLQRARAKESSGQEPESPVDVHRTDDGLSGDRPAFSSIYQSVSRSVVDLEQGKGEPEREGERETAIAGSTAVHEVAQRFGEFAKFPLGLVRAARNPDSVAATLLSHLDGMHGPAYTPEVIALAAQEYAASDESAAQGFKPRLFAGFVRRAEGTVKLTESRKQQQNETRFIRAEVEERDRVGDEIAAEEKLIREWREAQDDDDAYSRLLEHAERRVPAKWKGGLRAPMVRAELVKMIREETTRAAS